MAQTPRGTGTMSRGTALPSRVQEALNRQIQHEFASAYIYLGMSAWCEERNLNGSAKWLRAQAREEIEHGMKFFDHILDRNGHVALQAIDSPPADFNSLLGVFEKAYAHEQQVTGQIRDLYALSLEEKDYPSQPLLEWFLAEQIEEEKSTSDIVAKLQLVGESGEAIYLVDRDLGEREG